MWCVTQVIIRLISFLLESLIISLTCYDHTVNWQELCFWSILCPFGHVLGLQILSKYSLKYSLSLYADPGSWIKV